MTLIRRSSRPSARPLRRPARGGRGVPVGRQAVDPHGGWAIWL